MSIKISLKTLNMANQAEFTQHLSGIYEHSSWIPNKAWHHRPFTSIESLHNTMLKIVEDASQAEKLKLLQAHPQLAGQEAKAGTLTNASSQEQTSAKLNALNSNEMNEITQLNKTYLATHHFPFIIAVKGHNKESIFDAFRRRVNNATQIEQIEAISQVGLIASFRLNALLTN